MVIYPYLNLPSRVTYFLTLWLSLRYTASFPPLPGVHSHPEKIFAGEQPFNEKKSDGNVIFAILNGSRPVLPESIESKANLANLVRQSWSENADQRPTARQICRRLRLVRAVFRRNRISDRFLDNLVRGLVSAFFLKFESLSDFVIRMDTIRGYLPV